MEVNTQFASGYYPLYRSNSKDAAKEIFTTSVEKDSDCSAASQRGVDTIRTMSVSAKVLYDQQANIAIANKIVPIQPEQIKDLGIGFLTVGNVGYGMSAEQIRKGNLDDVVVRVKITKDKNQFETYDVNLSEVNPSNATAIEMFAFCQYADANGTGVKSTWGSWHTLKAFSNLSEEGLAYASIEEAASKKMNFVKILSESTFTMQKQATGEMLSAVDLFQMLKETFIETHKLTKANSKNEDDWRKMSDDQWEKLLARIDQYIDEYKEELENKEKLQKEAAMKAAAKAPAEWKTSAASEAARNAFVPAALTKA
ncbi:MAG: hypothetical protein ACI4HI_10815 [Lachnospiraceae bacterium]